MGRYFECWRAGLLPEAADLSSDLGSSYLYLMANGRKQDLEENGGCVWRPLEGNRNSEKHYLQPKHVECHLWMHKIFNLYTDHFLREPQQARCSYECAQWVHVHVYIWAEGRHKSTQNLLALMRLYCNTLVWCNYEMEGEMQTMWALDRYIHWDRWTTE